MTSPDTISTRFEHQKEAGLVFVTFVTKTSDLWIFMNPDVIFVKLKVKSS